ncbi:hypothetical protein CDV31_017380 [Fusarium ambrosium]|uniref:Uncharacterized protein n=1 Tax=Fusarium ambrosium TaxID=131363 RepID=A0A428RFL0_9HYPO|nr:hypothetical protein CDV31_017380 [Fusarium ambrosium]
MHPVTIYYGSFLSGPNYCQPETIDPSLILLPTTSSVFEGAQGTTLSSMSEAPHLAVDTPDMFAESWVFGPREYTCEGCPLQHNSRSVAPLHSQVGQETTMPVPDHAPAVCHIRPEQQQCQYGGPRLASETGNNQGITDVMNQQRGCPGSIADFPSDWPEGDAPTIMMPWDPSFIFYGEILAEPFEQGHFNCRELRSDAPDGEVLRVPDDWEMVYATGEEKVNQTTLFGACERTQDHLQGERSFIMERDVCCTELKRDHNGSGPFLTDCNRIQAEEREGNPFERGDACFEIWKLVSERPEIAARAKRVCSGF